MTIVPSTFSTAATATMPGILNQAVFASVVKGEKQYCKIRKYFHNLTFFFSRMVKKENGVFLGEKSFCKTTTYLFTSGKKATPLSLL